MKQLYGPYLNYTNFTESATGEEYIYVNSEDILFSLPAGYDGDVLFTIYPYAAIGLEEYFPWVGSTYTLRLYCYDHSGGTVFLAQESIKVENFNAEFFALQVKSFNFDIAYTPVATDYFFATIASDKQGTPYVPGEDEQIAYNASVYITTFEDTDNRVDVATILGETPISEDDLAGRILEEPNNLLLTDENGYVTPTDLSLQDLYAAIAAEVLATTGGTSGGTWTINDILKVLSAWAAGKWRDKTGSSGIYEILDPDDNSTVILEVTLTNSTPYRQTTYKG